MSSNRKIVFTNGLYYHVFNRGFERREIFTNLREFRRAFNTINYYRFDHKPLRFSRYILLPEMEQQQIFTEINHQENKLVEIIAYCLMPNHFHFILQQLKNSGIKKFISDFTNSYTKYFNTRHDRDCLLLQGVFKAVPVDADEQLIHLSRYIHLNPVVSSLVKSERPEDYSWSSYKECLKQMDEGISDPKIVLDQFPSRQAYQSFVNDHKDYAKRLEEVKHLSLE